MNSRKRIESVLDFQKPDRLPVVEWAPYWDLTIKRWKSEGLPNTIQTNEDIRDYFELDRMLDIWIRPRTSDCPVPKSHGKCMINNSQDYDKLLPFLYPTPALDSGYLERLAKAQDEGAAIWIWFEAFFWHPRVLFGIEEHLYAFYDYPELMKRMNDDLLSYLHTTLEQICKYVSPQFIALADDMSYNHGPMISKAAFDEHLALYYVKASSYIKEKGIKVFVDSDGLVDDPIDWYMAAGCQGFLPLEKQAGVDLRKYRQRHPSYLFVGGFDKLCMSMGEDAMRAEFERLLPVMSQGGYIPGVDHQTPPEVSFQDYKLYISLLREYANRAADRWTGLLGEG